MARSISICSVAAVLAIVAVPGSVPAAEYSQGVEVLHYWPMDFGSFADIVGGLSPSNAGTSAVAATTDALGRGNSALDFDDADPDSYLHFPNALYLSDKGTLEGFVRLDKPAASSQVSYYVSAASLDGRLYLVGTSNSTGELVSNFGDASAGNTTVAASSDYALGAWQYVALTWEKQAGGSYTVTGYTDDGSGSVVQTDQRTYGGNQPAPGTTMSFGRFHTGGQYLDGGMDDVAIYNDVLSTDQMTNHLAHHGPLASRYQQLISGTSGLIHYWPLDNGGAEDIVGNVDSGNRDVGLITNALGPGTLVGQSAIKFHDDDDSIIRFDDGGSALDLSSVSNGTLELWARIDKFSDPDPVDGTVGYLLGAATNTTTNPDRLYIKEEQKNDGSQWLTFGFGSIGHANLADVTGREGEWIYVALTWTQNGSNYDIATYYTDAAGLIQPGVTATASGQPLNGGTLRLGGLGSANQALDGALDEIAIYNRLLSTNEMQARFDNMMLPEPSTLAILVLGLVPLLCGRPRRR